MDLEKAKKLAQGCSELITWLKDNKYDQITSIADRLGKATTWRGISWRDFTLNGQSIFISGSFCAWGEWQDVYVGFPIDLLWVDKAEIDKYVKEYCEAAEDDD